MSSDHLSFGEYVCSLAGICTFFLIFLIATPLIILLLLVSFGKGTNFVVEKIAPLMMKPVFAVAGIDFSIKQHGIPVDQPAVYIINHSSTLDLLTILALGLPRIRFVAKWELQYNPVFFILGRLTGQLFIQREKSEKAIETLKKSYRRVKKDKLSLLMAPEGSRKHPGIIGPFKKGAFRVAIDLKYPIVPVYFEGNRRLSVGGSLISRSGKVTAHIHPPIDTTKWSVSRLDEHIRDVRALYLQWAEIKENNSTAEVQP